MCYRSSKKSITYLQDSWNLPFLIAGSLMIIGCLQAYSGHLAWLGLVNWIPFFWCFWSFQQYLLSSQARRKCGLLLLVGTLPVIITGFGQLWFDWRGPWQILNGLVIWFIDPLGNPLGRLSGLFDYANIAGAWLSIIWPFSLATLFQQNIRKQDRISALIFSIALGVALFLTNSRNAWGGLFLSVPLVLGLGTWHWLIPLLLIILLVAL